MFIFVVLTRSLFLTLWPSYGKFRASPSLRVEQFDSRWMDFGEILYLNLLLKSGETVKVWLKSDKQQAFHVSTYLTYICGYFGY